MNTSDEAVHVLSLAFVVYLYILVLFMDCHEYVLYSESMLKLLQKRDRRPSSIEYFFGYQAVEYARMIEQVRLIPNYSAAQWLTRTRLGKQPCYLYPMVHYKTLIFF
jgi:hypothetical protein